ncbi:hypothetical protein G6F35_017036 [Rhizopus arrhizus]|nr:hypothetical protein G6F35_017036 [Rhizopus arrhizus]
MAQFALDTREFRVALRVFDQPEVFVAVERVRVDVVLHAVVEHAGRERRVARMLAQGQVDVVRGLAAKVCIAQFVRVGGQSQMAAADSDVPDRLLREAPPDGEMRCQSWRAPTSKRQSFSWYSSSTNRPLDRVLLRGRKASSPSARKSL